MVNLFAGRNRNTDGETGYVDTEWEGVVGWVGD